MARGNMFKKIKIRTSILDIAPTILAIYGIEIPNRMDGRVLTECIHPDILTAMDIRVEEELVDDERDTMNEDDLNEMKAMMESLGYM